MHYRPWIILFFSIILAGCAAYKELQPVPEISFAENGYIELLDDEENFELSEGKKYFIKFPQPLHENTYLVFTFNDKTPLTTYLTRAFDDGEGTIIKIPDESDDPKTSSVYLLDRTVPVFYWVIENVKTDHVLKMTYRYVAVWRYKFEKKRDAFQNILTANTQPRDIVNAIGTSIKLSDVDYSGEQKNVSGKTKNLEQVYQQLGEIEAIFPADILNSQDPAYKDYLNLKSAISTEIDFQKSYKNLLEMLTVLGSSQPDIDKFVRFAPDYGELISETPRFEAEFYTAVRTGITRVLPGVVPYYEQQLRKKTNSTPIDADLQPVTDLYAKINQSPEPNYKELETFIKTYNQHSNAAAEIRGQLNQINSTLQSASAWPIESFYADKRAEISQMLFKLPPSDMQAFGKYQSYACAALLSKSISGLYRELRDLDEKMQRATVLVPQINTLRTQGNYSEILRLLKQNQDITFLRSQYAELDELSLKQQRNAISRALALNDFNGAENALQHLAQDRNFINPEKIIPRKEKMTRAYEDSIQTAVENLSVNNANAFIEAHKLSLDQIDSLYSNPALYPVHTFSFSLTPGGVAQKNSTLVSRMDFLRTEKFPETAIEALYKSFVDEMHVKGVEKARAIVAHGKYYQGKSSKFRNLIAECDPTASKWITEPKEYRKIYALPITTNPGGTNTYMIRINLRIPSDANFPVYDVNIRLPQEVARHAGSKQWYESITFNKKILKNEGRFTITAPDPDNDYIAQITPLQVNKTGDNVLEIRFSYNAFKVLEVSVMAQKPIIKKN